MANERGIHHSVSNNYSNKIDDIYADEFNQISCVNTHKDNNDKDDLYKGNDTAGGNHVSHSNIKNTTNVTNNSVDDDADDYDDEDCNDSSNFIDGIDEERHPDNHKRIKIVLGDGGHSDDDDDDNDHSEAEYTSEVEAFVKAYCSRK